MSLASTDAEPPADQIEQFRAELHLGSYPTAPACARSWTRAVLAEWHLNHLADDTELVVSEMVANAILVSESRHEPTPITIGLISDQSLVLVMVQDTCSDPPVRTHADADDESGRGLMIIQALTQESGWYRPRNAPTGKVVWCLIRAE